ncbi:hypothetical protein [Thaumasiovibrio sp. DFM-14]|uniref:hypothetical protein n=1 Tax=Thaumasiovibrio sp. DFM-14 TaxID=3384792 RepID=UPI0039A35360
MSDEWIVAEITHELVTLRERVVRLSRLANVDDNDTLLRATERFERESLDADIRELLALEKELALYCCAA